MAKRKLTTRQTRLIIKELLAIGWIKSDCSISAPNGTMSFDCKRMWEQPLRDFRNRMLGRRHRIEEASNSQDSLDDVNGLASILDRMSPDGSLEKFFAPLETTLVSFARAHNLRLGRYSQGEEGWDYVFKHSEIGFCRILVVRNGRASLEIQKLWWLLQRPLQFLAPVKTETVRARPRELKKILLNSLREILSWKPELLKQVADDLPVPDKKTQREIDAHSRRYYPKPRL